MGVRLRTELLRVPKFKRQSWCHKEWSFSSYSLLFFHRCWRYRCNTTSAPGANDCAKRALGSAGEA
eukprot:14679573-Alexandrium_andersonii.AAC.1